MARISLQQKRLVYCLCLCSQNSKIDGASTFISLVLCKQVKTTSGNHCSEWMGGLDGFLDWLMDICCQKTLTEYLKDGEEILKKSRIRATLGPLILVWFKRTDTILKVNVYTISPRIYHKSRYKTLVQVITTNPILYHTVTDCLSCQCQYCIPLGQEQRKDYNLYLHWEEFNRSPQ